MDDGDIEAALELGDDSKGIDEVDCCINCAAVTGSTWRKRQFGPEG